MSLPKILSLFPQYIYYGALSITIILGTYAAASDTQQRDFGYGAMEIYKLNKGTAFLKSQDLDSDGLDDIIFINNEKSRLEILFRKNNAVPKELSLLDDLFDNRGMMIDQRLSLYRIVDLNGDKKPDVLTFGTPLGLHIRWQEKDREFSSPHHIFLTEVQDIKTIQTGDINEDGLDDIIVSRRNGAKILWNDKQQSFTDNKYIPYSKNDCYWLELVDANKDGHLDLLQYHKNKKNPLKVRLGNGKGEFAAAHILSLPRMNSISLIEPRDDDALMLSCVLKNMLGTRLYGFEQSTQPVMLKTQEFTPQRLPIPGKGKASTLSWVSVDFNNDKYDDILVSSPSLSQLNLYNGCANGLDATPIKYNTLTEVNGMVELAKKDILVVSTKEKAVGIHRHNKMDVFPELLDIKGKLIMATAITGTHSIYLLRRDDEKIFVDHYNDTKLHKSWPVELDNDPVAMRAFTMDSTKSPLVGLLLFVDYSTPEMLLLGTNGVEKVEVSKFRALSQNLKSSQINEIQPGSGKILIVAGGSTVRQYEWKDNSYHIKQQFNPMNKQAEAELACIYHNKKQNGIMVYDSNSENLLWYANNKTGIPKKIHIADGNGGFNGIVQLKNKKRSVFILIADQEIAMLVDGGEILTIKELGAYMSKSEKPSLRISRPIEIGKLKRPAIAIIDAANRAVEIVSKNADGIKSELAFPAFLKSDMVGPKEDSHTEPHDITSGDINGDGYPDMILLVHDNLLIYFGE